MATLRTCLEAQIQNRHLLNHEFYARWQAGNLKLAELQGYAKEYYAFESEFPRFISAIHCKLADQKMRQKLLDNLIHEEQGSENHIELWLRFAEGLGVSRSDVKEHFRSDETEQLLRVFRKHANSENPIDGLAALYAYERQQPEVARQKAEGLKCFYGITDENTVSFFKAHQTQDVYHSETEMELLVDICQTPEQETRAQAAVEEVLDSLYEFLDGVQRRYR